MNATKDRFVANVIRDAQGARVGYKLIDSLNNDKLLLSCQYHEDARNKFVARAECDFGNVKSGEIRAFATMLGVKNFLIAEITGESVTSKDEELLNWSAESTESSVDSNLADNAANQSKKRARV